MAMEINDNGYWIENNQHDPAPPSHGEPIILKWLTDKGITCEYEPHTFRLGDNERGITPDIYVPEWGIYIECCGKHVGGKYRRIARLRQRWPDVPVIVFNARKTKRVAAGQWSKINARRTRYFLLDLWREQCKNNLYLHELYTIEKEAVYLRYPNLYRRFFTLENAASLPTSVLSDSN